MKILAIRGKNLASLEGEFEIDFTTEPLKSAGIFAITGSTGSGKSTLLDALCLSLFDETPRNNRTLENINIIDVKDKTINQKDSRNLLRRGTSDGYAEIDFISLGGEAFRSRWSVRRSRDKADGSLQNTEFRLTNLTANREVQGRKTELLAKIVGLIGLTFDQFTRAVLLAQGDFATFLKATQKEKAELLEKLTGTDVYSRISASIYEKSKNAGQELALLTERIKGIELLPEEELEALSVEKRAITTEIELLKAGITELTAKIKWITDEEILKHGVEQAEEALKNSQEAIGQAKDRYDYIAKIDSVQEIRDRYKEVKNTGQQLTENKANRVRQESERDTNAVLLKQASEKVIVCEAGQKQYHQETIEMEPQIRQARALDIRIAGARTNAGDAQKEYEQAVLSSKKTEKSIATTQAAIRSTEQTITAIDSWFQDHASYKEIIPRVDLIINLLDDVTTAHKQGAHNAKILTESKTILDSDVQKLTAQKTEAERLNHLLPAEIAVLREKLAEGTPCPVCGSLHHPLSNIQGESLEEAELNKAKTSVNDQIMKLTESIESRKNEMIRLQSVIAGYETQSGETVAKLNSYLKNLPLWQQQSEQDALQDTLKTTARDWNEYTSSLTKSSERITNLKTALQLEQKSLDEVAGTLKIKEQKQKTTAGELEQLLTERAEMLSGKSADNVEQTHVAKGKEITDRLAVLTAEKGVFASKGEKYSGIIAQIAGEITKLSEQLVVAQKEVEHWVLARNGAITMEQLAELFSKDSQWLSAEREALNRLREHKTIAQATFSERYQTLEKHAETNGKPTENESKESLLTLLADKNALADQTTKRSAEIEMLFANHARGKARIQAFEKELEEKSILAENWKKLNELFGSADGSKFKVLAQGYTLDALLAYANKHLQELSSRYELQRIPDTLALQVVDLDMLGEIRTVHSLSGGESFLISLALALGLASLSSNRMKVESLFIDEGFGSLDIDTLRVAMDALERLQTQGRKIGVISHVAEMTERITTQIKVIKTVNGRSRIEIV